MSLVKNVAQHFVARAKAQQLKGKARDRAAIEFAVGAASGYAGAPGSEVQSEGYAPLAFFAFMVSSRGYSYVEEEANRESAS